MFSFFKPLKSINVNEIDHLLGSINLIDVREPYEYQNGHLPKAVNIPMSNLISTPEKYLDLTKEYYIICQAGSRSARTCNILKDKGFNVINVSGGTGGYIGKLDR